MSSIFKKNVTIHIFSYSWRILIVVFLLFYVFNFFPMHLAIVLVLARRTVPRPALRHKRPDPRPPAARAWAFLKIEGIESLA